MAVHSLQAAPAHAKVSEVDRLHAAWRYAKAQWEINSYAPENYRTGLALDADAAHCDNTCRALDALLLQPAETTRDLATKLRVFRDEEIQDGWHIASEIVAVLASDAHRLAFDNLTGA